MKAGMYKPVIRSLPSTKLFRTLVAAFGLLLLLVPTAQAQFTWPVYEPFGEYVDGAQLGKTNDSYNPWYFGNNGTNGIATYIITNAAALSFPALLADTNPVPKGLQEVPTSTTSADRGAGFPPQTNTTIYASFLLNYQDNGAAVFDRLVFQVVTNAPAYNNPGSFTRAYMSVWLTPDYRIKINKNYNSAPANFTAATSVLSTNVPHLIVVRYLKASPMDEMDLWVDPTPFGDDSRIPPPMLSTTNAPNINVFNGVMVNNRKFFASYSLNVFQLDEIRLANTWSGVTPLATPAPGPMFTVGGGGTGCPGNEFAVTLSGSVANNDYWLYTNGVYAGVTMTGTGSALNLGSFSTLASYSILASNNVNANLGWMSNSVTINVRAPVAIVNQPIPAITATNSRAEFDVSATGDQLSYHWYKDGSQLSDNSHISGSASNSLVVWPATTADIGGYYCIITNPCSLAPSYTTTNSLTLDAPSSLIWYGNHFNANYWDIGISPTWNGGGVVFNEGDNVTFDDTYSGATYGSVLTLSNTLTPTLITYSTAQQLIFSGTGSLAGSGSLLMSGSGRLIISNLVGAGVFQANPYTGGTVINNGTVYVQIATGLGTGPITLAGGGLETLGKLAFSNNVLVTANSTCQLDQTGNQSITFLGPLIGNSGTTLLFTNSSTLTNSPNWVNLNSALTNNSAIVLSVNSLATNAVQRLILNGSTNGPQNLNGAISEFPAGVGGIIKQGTGASYLNGVNTYTLGTTNTAGLLAGSGSINSPLTVFTNGILGGGPASGIGTFTVSNSITLIGGDVLIRVDKSLAQSNDLISATGAIANLGAGTVTVSNLNLGLPITAGDTYRIFSGAVTSGGSLGVTGSGVAWVNNLAANGTIQVANTIASYPTNLSYGLTNGTLTIHWPTTHLGWFLASQTNALNTGLRTTWTDIAGSENATVQNIPVVSTNPTVFYRLRHP